MKKNKNEEQKSIKLKSEKKIENFNETKNSFFEKIKKINTLIAILTMKINKRLQIANISNERENIMTDPTDRRRFNKCILQTILYIYI